VAVAEALMAGTWWLPVAGASAVAAVGLTDLLLQDRDRKWSAYFGGAAVAGTGVALLLLQAIAFGATRPPTDTGLKPLPLHGTLVPAGSLDAAALWARDSTPAAARFLIPPDYGEFRVLASRAIVIDFKAFTFAPSAMVIWLQRIDAVCGRELRLGQEWSTEVREAYAERTGDELRAAAVQYGASYVLVRRTDLAAAQLGVPVYENRGAMLFAVDATALAH
jgi:hypothetical protein